ncbi:nitronate monooxygenase [Emcibacter sp. SYSU 3D8]|uniref:NAD(P)H-dependent flavin oxidoreductase n=1 Tax=Emcibacter sp. SYSU 3D8 TaxID=3133969 RepID=UPI0031FF1316
MNRVLDHLGTKYPIIQSPMGWIARSQLASAVSNAGALGIIETSSGEIDQCMEEIRKMRTLTDKPFGVNLALLFLRDERMVDMVIDEGVKFVTTSAGSPAKYIDKLKKGGLTVYHAVPTAAMAMKAVDAGVDGLVVEGAEGGGYKNPEEVSLAVLLQSIREKSDIPMVAAGAIVDGRGMAAAFASGAEGIQMGTRFVSSVESPVHRNFKNAIVDGDETGTVVLNKKSTPCVRALKTERSMAIAEAGIMERSKGFGSVLDLYFGGDMEASLGLAGQGIGLIHEVKPVKQIIDETVDGFFAIANQFAAKAQARAF